MMHANQWVQRYVQPIGAGIVSVAALSNAYASTDGSCHFAYSCKAYDLGGAIESFAPAVGPDTAVVPLLNGPRHLDALDTRFGAGRVLGGSCFLSARLDEGGQLAHLSDFHRVAFGERIGGRSPRVETLAVAMPGAKFEAEASDQILLVM
jgi:2-dehydropantoate 2-reductase